MCIDAVNEVKWAVDRFSSKVLFFYFYNITGKIHYIEYTGHLKSQSAMIDSTNAAVLIS